jgi:anaerobic ribonucleoside-triphosphate reductase activating protein
MLPFVPRDLVTAASVLDEIARAQRTHGIEGATFLGGEPFLQAKGLAEVAAGMQDLGLSVMVFSGYTLEQLERLQPEGYEDLLRSTDLLVDGPYRREQPETRRLWVGSTNQRFHYLSDRYDASVEVAEVQASHHVEIRLGLNGRVTFNGWPQKA